MIEIPNPLHPAVVHFPIAFIVVGAIFALLGLGLRSKRFNIFGDILLILGAVGIYFATKSGGEAYSAFTTGFPAIQDTVHTHATWGDRAYYAAIITAVLAFIGFFLAQKPQLGKLVRAMVLVGAITSAFYVLKTAEVGGHMIYDMALDLNSQQQEQPAALAVE